MYDKLTFKDVLKKELEVMDLAAFCQCRDYGLPIRVFNIGSVNNIANVLVDESIGTLFIKESI